MSLYRVNLTQSVSAVIDVEADCEDDAIDAAHNQAPNSLCNHCANHIEMSNDWELNAIEQATS